MDDQDESNRRDADSSLVDVIDLAARRTLMAILIAGGAIALAIYSRPAPPRYEAIATGSGIVRVDTRTGTVLACEQGGCYTVVRHGQHLVSRPEPKALPRPSQAPTPAQPAQPAPQAQQK